jgi:hypothetical protein
MRLKRLALEDPKVRTPEWCREVFGIDVTPFVGEDGMVVAAGVEYEHVFLTIRILEDLPMCKERLRFHTEELSDAYVRSKRYREQDPSKVIITKLNDYRAFCCLQIVAAKLREQQRKGYFALGELPVLARLRLADLYKLLPSIEADPAA